MTETKPRRRRKHPPRPGQPIVSAQVHQDVLELARSVAVAERTSISRVVRDGLELELASGVERALGELGRPDNEGEGEGEKMSPESGARAG
jgi:hypothetical protein